jgi:hypothetical protein
MSGRFAIAAAIDALGTAQAASTFVATKKTGTTTTV